MNRFTKCLNRFRKLKDKAGKKMNDMMKIDAYHMRFESIQRAQKED